MAWKETPGYANPERLQEHFRCEYACGRDDALNDNTRSKLRCTRVDIPSVKWDDDKSWQPTPYMGRHSLTILQEKDTYQNHRVNWQIPPEDRQDGCPAGWYRCLFVITLHKYIRKRSSGGQRNTNPNFDRADQFIQNAVLYYESQQDAFYAYWEDAVHNAAKMQVK